MRKSLTVNLMALLMIATLILSACSSSSGTTPTSAAGGGAAAQATATTGSAGAAQPTATTAAAAQPSATTAAGAAQPTATTAAGGAQPTATTAAGAQPTATGGAAASGQSGQAANFDNVDPKGQKVVFWHNHTKQRQDALQQIIDDFNKTNQYGITVSQENQGSYADIFNKMNPILNSPDVPGIVVAYQNQSATYQLANGLTDLNPLVNSAKWGIPKTDQADYFPAFWNQDIFPNFGNVRLGFPLYRSEEVLYYNQDWLKELGYNSPPTTPDQFTEMACKAAKTPFSKSTAKGSTTGYEFDPGDASHFAAWTFAFGGNIYDAKSGQYTYNSNGAVQAASFVQNLFKNGCATLVTETNGDQTDFGAGKVLFTTSSSSGLPFYISAVGQGAKFNWTVGAIPHTTPDPVMDIYGASVSIPKSTPEKELAAWLFIKYFATPEVQAKWAQVSGYYPVRQSVASNVADYMSKNPAYKNGFDLLKYGAFEPPTPGYDFVRDMYSKAMAQLVASPYPDPKPILDKLNQDANANLQDQLSQMKK